MSVHSQYRAGLWHPYEKPMYGVLLNPYHPLAQGLVGCWLFNEGGGNTVFDLSGNSNHGSLGGGTASYCPVWTTETFGPALSFDNDYVDCGDDFTALSTEFTIEFWMKSSDTVHSGTPISYATTHSDNEILLHDYNAFLLFVGNVQFSSGVSATDGNLHHIVWTWKSSGGETKLYKDAEVVCSGVLQSGYTINHGTDRRMIIGQEQDSVGGGFDSDQAFYGTLSILRIYKRFLNPMEIWLLYTDPFCMFYHPLEAELLYSAAPPAGIVPQAMHHYRMLRT
ncbi:hypothetical protein DRN97_05060 [Methanosarcinales archaeon]|nr:MAG: hypothetical protein DRN97_05060 [Methanosarcinales archaeon]